MTILLLQNVSKSYGNHQILDQATFAVHSGNRAALVGTNGAGKSTILKFIMNLEEPDEGEISLMNGITIGYLPQSLKTDESLSIRQYIYNAQKELHALQRRLNKLSAIMATAEGKELSAALAEYGTVLSRFEQRGGYNIEYRIQLVMEGLGIGSLDEGRYLSTLSGGQQTRVGLAALLIETPDLLLLDEPTNHLDAQALNWLESYLSNYPGTLLMSSHDRHFLNRTVNLIIEVDDYTHKCSEYPGNYDNYKAKKRKQLLKWEDDYHRQQEEMKQLQERMSESGRQVNHNRPPTDNDKFAKHYFRGRVQNAISKKVRNAETKLERLQDSQIPAPPKPLVFHLDFCPEVLQGKTAMHVSGISKSYDGRNPVLRSIELSVEAGSRVLITGPNASGKSTLLHILAGRMRPDTGAIHLAEGVKVGYLEQDMNTGHRSSAFGAAKTVIEAYRFDRTGYEEDLIAELLASHLFRPEEINKPLSALSPGQFRKLELARLISSKTNLLVIDEPTNHLSPELIEQFEQALRQFPGPVIAVSHDRRFIEQFGGTVYRLDEGRLTS
ncbi:macrolide transport system ATP-binding/permease protein [Paenibacillus tianmuensis]|uniref:Macrolide transport system ATP-binding/permease protein n=1 Tax=Paenibacillus tianmuensis TaxID=624147 RepID=A0A1G4PNQ9_9BACL|nr:ABC-F family ATP-binding cassette domain-containing protein [Paenibacillus tianmuensis]SCW33689.1 macrolide transport system ATP-binding/permease protein [Paenibacillus tianmuensis]